ncbi:Acetylcholine receptor subunit beta-like 2, partial [Orchesella cincta]
VTLAISILISLHVFFLLVVEIIPPTSLVVPLLGKYLIFAMILVSISICVTVVVLNVHFRSPQTHTMAPWVRRVFLHILPRLLVMRRPHYSIDTHRNKWKESVLMIRTANNSAFHHSDNFWQEEQSPNDIPPRSQSPLEACLRRMADGSAGCRLHGGYPSHDGSTESWLPDDTLPLPSPLIPKTTIPCSNRSCVQDLHVHRACAGVRFIARHTRIQEDSTKVKEDWKYVAMVLDRLFLWIFTLAVLVGTAGIILQAPSLYDDRVPIDKKYSEISGSRAS